MKQPDLGKRIAELRKQKGLTQEELVDRCNINVRTIQRIETGEVTPRPTTLRIIFEALEANLQQFEQEENVETGFNPFKSAGLKNLLQMGSSTPHTIRLKQLQLAWVLAIVSFMLDFVVLFFENQNFLSFNFSKSFVWYPLVKIIALLAYLYWQRGIALLGVFFKNHLLAITSFILIGFALFNNSYQFITYYYPNLKNGMLDSTISITIGAILILYAWGIWRLKKAMGTIAWFAGISSFIAGLFFITILFWWVGLIVIIALDLFEMILLYKGYDLLKEKKETLEPH